MKIGFAQINTTVGDLDANCEKIITAYRQAVTDGADLVIAPELAISGYPPQDLVFKSQFVPKNLEALRALMKDVGSVPLIVGYIDYNIEQPGPPFRNAAAVLKEGALFQKVFKTLLPNYDVFDEVRYFQPGANSQPCRIGNTLIGITICEDIWSEDYLPGKLYTYNPIAELVQAGAELIINISASPYQLGKPEKRYKMVSEVAAKYRRPILYCNMVGGNDQLIFDGQSFAYNKNGQRIALFQSFKEEVFVLDSNAPPITHPTVPIEQELFNALSLGLKDYVKKCGFKSVVLGLSGGIDSAITACIAVDAIGAKNVVGVSMPSPYSSQGSIDDALHLARNLGIECLQIPINKSFEIFKSQFAEIFSGMPEDATEENMQARLRGMTLMALSNKFGHLLLTTGNKSELAVGYCTLYGDMAGGLAVISDVPKTTIYKLARWINREKEIIPHSTIEKPPSAELKPNQTDQDTLPPYELLDEILQLYVEENISAQDIIKRGYDEITVRWIQRRVDLNEYKRKQAAPGLKVTSRAFGSGRRMPIAQKFVD